MTVLNWGIEKDLKSIADIGNIPYDPQKEIKSTQDLIASGTLNSQDKSQAQNYLNGLLGSTKEGGTPGAAPTGGLASALQPDATKQFLDTGKLPEGAPLNNTSVTGWIGEQIGNVSFVVLGVVVVGVALVLASSASRKFVIESATAAVGG